MNASSFNRSTLSRTAAVLIALATLATTNSWGYRVIAQPEEAYEFLLSEVTLPATTTGVIRFLDCSECVATSLRVAAATTYQLNGVAMSLDALLLADESIRETEAGDENTAVTVFFDVETLRVNRIAVENYR